MQFDAQTRLRDLAETYPWLIDAVAAKDDRLRIVKTPFGRALIKRSNIADVSRMSGYPVEEILKQLNQVIEEHELA